jgi:hypothetical protein
MRGLVMGLQSGATSLHTQSLTKIVPAQKKNKKKIKKNKIIII